MLTLVRHLGTVAPPVVPEGYAVRPSRRSDTVRLGDLYFESYDPGVAADSLDDAVADIRASFDGEYGDLMEAASPVALHDDGVLVGAVLTVRRAPWDDTPDCPFIIEVFTDRAHRRRGIAKALVATAAAEAHRDGETHIALRVDGDNTAAVELYQGLGFVTWDR